jgi:CDGSH-type Zn-finger protein
MPEVSSQEKEGHIRHIFKLRPGEKVILYRCYQSQNFPFCDGTHRKTANALGPAVVEIPPEEEPKPE